MQVDIKTVNVAPKRNTFSHLARRFGVDKAATRYQEACYDLQPEANFHYRPLWAPQYQLYDAGRTALAMSDWYAFKDPRQFYYGTYTQARSKQQAQMEKILELVEKKRLLQSYPPDIQRQIALLFIPLRHAEWGANTNNCAITAYGFGVAITQATMFQTLDRLAIAQYLTRIGLLLADHDSNLLTAGKNDWLHHPAWQPLRCQMEEMMVQEDWFELLIAQDLVLDGLLFPLFYQHIVDALMPHGPALALLSEFMNTWFAENQRWVDSVVKTAVAESPDNARLVAGWTRRWLQPTLDALLPLAEIVFDHEAPQIMAQCREALNARLTKSDIAP